MQTLPILNFNDLAKTIRGTVRLAELKYTVKRYPGIKEVREACESADAVLFDPLSGISVSVSVSVSGQ